ncbi:hypothetical protein L9F63_015984, partial [Diploptera punctata]
NIDTDCTVGLLQPLTDVVVAPPGTKPAQTKPVEQSKQNESNQSLAQLLIGTFRNLIPTQSPNKHVTGIEDDDSKRLALLQKLSKKRSPLICRVHRLKPPEPVNSADKLLLQPYNVFVRRCWVPDLDTKDLFLCKLRRGPTPPDTTKSTSKEDDKKSSDGRKESVYARLIIVEGILEELSDIMKEYVNKETFKQKTGHLIILVSDAVRTILGRKVGGRVCLEFVTSASSQVVSGIEFSPLGHWEDSDPNEKENDVETLCRRYIATQVETHPLVLSSGAVLPVSDSRSVLATLSPPETEYAVLDPERVRRCRFTFKERLNVHLPVLDDDMIKEETSSLYLCLYHSNDSNWSKLATLFSEGVTSLELSLKLTPLAATLLPLRSNLCADNVLILGSAGSGKTSLVRAICRHLRQPPHYIHSTYVQCKQLKGKSVETLHKMVTQWLNECIYYQPAVLVLDDLASIAGVGNGMPGDEETNYFTRIAAMLNRLITQRQTMNCISVIATAPSVLKLNSYLVASRGVHVFNTHLQIPELHENDRVEILKHLASHRSDTKSDSLESIDWNDIANRTDGFVVQDLADLVNKSVFEAFKRAGSDGNVQQAELCEQDIEEGLKNSIPLLQRGVQLFDGEALTWDDVGGLSEVKQVLIEVLQWPSQYPEVFENAPLRHQTGLLLYGAPGTGKTLLAGAVAHECNLRFISVKGPELLSKYIGASEEGVRNIFHKAQSAKPCVLFFDEFDSLAPRRGHDSTGVTDRVVNQLLTQLDGVESLRGVWVMAATSRPDMIDPALLRPGRLDRAVLCPLPDKAARLSILLALSRKLTMSHDVDLEEIAVQAEGFTGADLQAVLYTAQLAAVEQTIPSESDLGDDIQVESSCPVVTQKHLRTALRDTRPSLSDAEKLKYTLIYERFARSRGGNSAEDMASMPQRATLA